MKMRFLAVASGLFLATCAAEANEINFSGVVTSVQLSAEFPPDVGISIGDPFSGFIVFDSSNTVFNAEVDFPKTGGLGGGEFPAGTLTPISNGYSFTSGFFPGGLGGTDSFFEFEFHDNVNSFDAVVLDFPQGSSARYDGRITHFVVSAPESGETILLLAISMIALLPIRAFVKRCRVD